MFAPVARGLRCLRWFRCQSGANSVPIRRAFLFALGQHSAQIICLPVRRATGAKPIEVGPRLRLPNQGALQEGYDGVDVHAAEAMVKGFNQTGAEAVDDAQALLERTKLMLAEVPAGHRNHYQALTLMIEKPPPIHSFVVTMMFSRDQNLYQCLKTHNQLLVHHQ